MNNFTTNTFEMKRDIVKFSNKLCKNFYKPETKYLTDMIYGKDFMSNNSVTYEGLNKVVSLLNEKNLKDFFVNDKGYDSNDIFN